MKRKAPDGKPNKKKLHLQRRHSKRSLITIIGWGRTGGGGGGLLPYPGKIF
jgi:hypothetical protein